MIICSPIKESMETLNSSRGHPHTLDLSRVFLLFTLFLLLVLFLLLSLLTLAVVLLVFLLSALLPVLF